ncbi:MAG: YncE family protein [Acidobacteriota bacterium]|nr:YncE family protein [Acidobacteriota bacterium]
MTKQILTLLPILLFASLLPVQAQTDWQVKRTFNVGGQGGWDYLTMDPETHRLYVPRSTHTMVIDSESGKTIADIPGQKIAHGVAVVPQAGRGFISDGGGNGAIVIFDLKTNAILGSIVAQPDADGIIYDPSSGRVVVVSGDGGTLMSIKPDIDPKTGKIDAPVELGGAPEFLASDGAGKVYVNLMDKNEVAVVDMKARKVVARWPVTPGGAPVGMTIDTAKRRLLIGCRKPQKLIVMSTENGKVLADLPIGDHVDAVKIDKGQIFASCGDGTLAVAGETSPGKFEIVQTVKTPKGARTMGVDPTTHRIYLPTAEPGTGPEAGKRGNFVIVVVSRGAA